MKTSSAKAKGRLLQQTVATTLTNALREFGLEDGDIRSTSMGCPGVDLLLSPAAQNLVGPLCIECKNCESLAVTTVFWEHQAKYQDKPAILVSKRNKTKPLVTMTFEMYMELLTNNVKHLSRHKDDPR